MERHDLNNAASEGTGRESGSSITPRQERLIVAVVLAAFVALAIGFSLGPIFESQDEKDHYRYVRELAGTGTLPDPFTGLEYIQPPLYYALCSLIKLPIDDSDFGRFEGGVNPHRLTVPALLPGNDNKNLWIHTHIEEFPYANSGTARAVHLIRLLSVVLGIGTLATSYAIFRLLWPDHPTRRLIAISLVAFWPTFLYMSGTINNDNLVRFLCTFFLFLLLRQLRDGPSRLGGVLLGAVLGAALLAKVTAVILFVPLGVAIMLSGRRIWRFVPLILVVAAAIAGWWYIRNAVAYGDPTALAISRTSMTDAWIEPGTSTLWDGLTRMLSAYEGLWARFGWNQSVVLMDGVFGGCFNLLTLFGLVGAIARLVKVLAVERWSLEFRMSSPLQQSLVLGSFSLALLAALFYMVMNNRYAGVGRHLLPGIAVWAALLAFGLDAWIPHRRRVHAALRSTMILAALAGISLFGYFLPAYRPLSPPAQIEYPRSIRYGNSVELIGVGQENIRTHPGEIVTITLYWRAMNKTDADLWFLLDGEHDTITPRSSIPGSGNLPSYEWVPGQIWTERYVIVVSATAELQNQSPLLLSVYDVAAQQTLTPIAPDGRSIKPVIGWIIVTPTD